MSRGNIMQKDDLSNQTWLDYTFSPRLTLYVCSRIGRLDSDTECSKRLVRAVTCCWASFANLVDLCWTLITLFTTLCWTLITLLTTQSETFISENGTPSYPHLQMGVLVTLTHIYLSFIHIISLYLREWHYSTPWNGGVSDTDTPLQQELLGILPLVMALSSWKRPIWPRINFGLF